MKKQFFAYVHVPNINNRLLGIYLNLWLIPKALYKSTIKNDSSLGIFSKIYIYFVFLKSGIKNAILDNTPKFLFKNERDLQKRLWEQLEKGD